MPPTDMVIIIPCIKSEIIPCKFLTESQHLKKVQPHHSQLHRFHVFAMLLHCQAEECDVLTSLPQAALSSSPPHVPATPASTFPSSKLQTVL